jgi:hypothetical protein
LPLRRQLIDTYTVVYDFFIDDIAAAPLFSPDDIDSFSFAAISSFSRISFLAFASFHAFISLMIA